MISKIKNMVSRLVPKGKANPTPETKIPLCVFSGTTLQGKLPITIAYAGNDKLRQTQWAALIMEKYTSRQIESCSSGLLVKHLRKNAPDCSLVLIEKQVADEDLLRPKSSLLLPYFMQTCIDTSQTIEVKKKESRTGFKNAARLISKFGLTYQMTNTLENQYDFYNNMYLPYLKDRHGTGFQQVQFDGVFSPFVPFELMSIMQGGKRVAGGVLHFKNGKVHFGFLGVRDGVFHQVKNGALAAAYYFLCDEMNKRGVGKLYLGGSPPFIDNPLTRYKIRMTAQLDHNYQYQDRELVCCVPLKYSAGMQDFLTASPIISVNGNKNHTGHFFLNKNSFDTIDGLKKEISLFARIGLSNNYFYQLNNRNVPESWIKLLLEHGFVEGSLKIGF